MGKVREHIQDDVFALTQWVYRKLNNHDPMSQRTHARINEPVAKGGGMRLPQKRVTAAGRATHTEETNYTFYESGGKRFKITVEEVA